MEVASPPCWFTPCCSSAAFRNFWRGLCTKAASGAACAGRLHCAGIASDRAGDPLVKADGRQSVEQPEQKWLRTRTADEEEEEEEEDEEEA